MENQCYTVEEFAKELNVNPETVRRWIRAGKLRADMTLSYGSQGISAKAKEDFLKTAEGKKHSAKLLGATTGMVAGIGGLAVALGGMPFGAGLMLGLTVELVSNMKRHRNEEMTHETLCDEVKQNLKEKAERLTHDQQETERQIKELEIRLEQITTELKQCNTCLENTNEIDSAVDEELNRLKKDPHGKHESK